MITLSKIRDLVLSQEKELESMIYEYFHQRGIASYGNYIKEDKEELKLSIEKYISEGKLDEGRKLLDQYRKIFGEDSSTYSMEGILELNENNLESALDKFIIGLELDGTDADLLYNIAHVNILLGNNQEAMYYYEECLKYTKDIELINEINNIIENISFKNKNYTLITYGMTKEESLVLLGENKVINLIEKDNILYENKYEDDGITICEVNPNQTVDMIDYLVRRNENCIIVFKDIYKLKNILRFKEFTKFMYYPEKNYYMDKSNYLNHNIDMFLEKEACNNSDLIITNDIKIYNYKKIIERRDNIYLIDSNIGELFTIDSVLNNIENVNEEDINNSLKGYIKTLDDEYEKSLYLIGSESDNLKNCIELSRYIYYKYKTEEMYHIYLSTLSQSNDYNNLAATVINSDYCNDIYKAEIIYLNAIKNYDLIKFIVNISINNYKILDETSNRDINYKLALYNFELNNFDIAFDKYIEIVNENSDIINSPIVNRNTGYLLYTNDNKDYEKFYNIYKELMESFYASDINQDNLKDENE